MIDFRNQDCMEGMKEYPDKYFDLAIVDPPYGISVTARHKAQNGSTPLVGGGRQSFRRYTAVTATASRR